MKAEIYLLWVSEAIWQTSNATYVHIKDVYQSENNGTVIVTGVTNVAGTGFGHIKRARKKNKIKAILFNRNKANIFLRNQPGARRNVVNRVKATNWVLSSWNIFITFMNIALYKLCGLPTEIFFGVLSCTLFFSKFYRRFIFLFVFKIGITNEL